MDRFGGAAERSLVGRGRERRRLEDIQGTLGVGPTVLLLLGDAGIGKTSLWAYGIRAAEPWAHVLVTRPSELDLRAAFSGLADLLRGHEGHIADLPEPARTALSRAVGLEAGDAALDQVAVAMAAADLLDALSAQRPVLLAVDDLPWLDPATTRVVGYVLRRLRDRPVGLLACQRGHAVPDMVRSPVPPERVHVLDLSAMTVDEVAELIRRTLGVAFLRPMIARVHAASGGNPFYALELARHVLLHPDPVSGRGRLPVPPTLTELVGRRLASVPAATREVLLVAATAQPATLAVLETVAGPRARAALQRGIDAGLVVLDGGEVRFTHPLLAETAYAQAQPARRRRLHLALAETAESVEVRAAHLHAGTTFPDEHVAVVLEEAAQAASARGAPEAAADFFTAAGDLTPADDPVGRQRRLLEGAHQCALAGQSDRAQQILAGLAPVAPPGPERGRVLLRIGLLERGTGGWTRALGTMRRALDEIGDDPTSRAELEQLIAVAEMQSGDLRIAEPHVRSAEAWSREGIDEQISADVEVAAIMHEVASGGRPREGRVARLVALGREANMTPRMDEASSMRVVEAAASLKWLDELDHAREILDHLVETLWTRQADGLLMPPLFQLCELECWSGRLDRARDLAARAEQTCERTGVPAMRSMSLVLNALLSARGGDLAAARRTAETCRTEATDSGDVRNLMRALAVQGFVELSAGNGAEAVAPLDQSRRLQEERGYGNPGVIRSAGDHIEARLAAGQVADAVRLTEVLVEQAERSRSPWATMAAHRSRALLAAQRADLPEARELLETALVVDRRTDPVETGRTLLALATVQRRSNQRATARATGQRALTSFTAVHAAAWADRAKVELQRLDGATATLEELTPMETEVAHLIADGRTNGEIASTLYVSPKTVEAHLTHIYRKLGLRSRTELAGRVTAQRTPLVPRETPDAPPRSTTYGETNSTPPRRDP